MTEHPQSPFLWQNNPRPSILLQDKFIRASETARRQGHKSKNITFTTGGKKQAKQANG